MKTTYLHSYAFRGAHSRKNNRVWLTTACLALSAALSLHGQTSNTVENVPVPSAPTSPSPTISAVPAPATTNTVTDTPAPGIVSTNTPTSAATTLATTTNTVSSTSTNLVSTTGTSTNAAPEATVTTSTRKAPISLENADLRQVLNTMAKQANMSIIIPDDVKGTVTARFNKDKTNLQIMSTLLEDKGYTLVELDGVYRIKSRDSINAEPTKTEVYQFTNASAKETKPTVDKLLTKVGNAQLDERSNTIVITDVPSNLAKVIPIIKTLDTPTPQVVIEAKLLETTQTPTLKTGINWESLASYRVAVQGVESLTVSQSTIGTTSAVQTTSTTTFGGFRPPITSIDDGIGTKLLKGLQQGINGGLFPVFGQLTAPEFAWTLSFLLSDTDTELLASPKVITADNKEAKIRIATQEPIPNFTFNQQTASFVISGFEFKDVGNILTVTPHVNRDNFVTLDVTPEISTAAQNGRSFALPGGSVTIPLISIRTLTSRIMVKSGNTLALGGLFSSDSSRAYTKVPFFGDIPVLGELFRSRSFSKAKRNLLIFITPTVIGNNGQTGLEDQYNRLRETDEDGRFAYKKSIVGNAKPMDQFKTIEEIDAKETTIWPNKVKKSKTDEEVEGAQEVVPAAEEKHQEEKAPQEPPSEPTPPEVKIDPDALTPVVAPSLRDE